jgi:predicted RNase H-like HicB family nuclease
MIQNHSRYTYHITWSLEDGEYIGLCTEFPSWSWLDKTPEMAFSGIRQVVVEAIADMQKNHESIPEPIATESMALNQMLGTRKPEREL